MKTLIRRIKKILVGRRLQGQLRRVISVIACVVVFATTYALVLPAITMESLAQCGIEAHEHTAGCYEKVLVCGQEETEGNSHTDDCWQVEKVLVCALEEHTHGPECRDVEGNLTCEKTEHVHDENCYREEKTLICGMEEAEGHTHTDACYEEQLICGKEVHIHSAECYENKEPGAEADVFAGGDAVDFTEDHSTDSSFTGDGFTDDGFIDNEFTDNGFTENDFTDGDITFTDADREYTEAADFGGADEFTEAAEAEDGSGFLETQGLEDGTVFEDPAGAEGGPAFEDPAYAENGSYYEDQETNNGYDDTAYVEEIADGAVPGDAGEALEDVNADPDASDAETPDGTEAVNPDEAGISTDPEGSTLNEDPSGQDGQEQNPDGSAGTDADKEAQSGEEAGEAGTDKTDNTDGTDTEAGTDRTAEAGAAGTQAQDGTAAETEKTEETKETKETEAAGPEETEADAAGVNAALADQTETEDKHEAEAAADHLQAPADLERFLTDRTGIWYYPAVFDEDGKADTADINSETVTDWKRVEEDTVLSPEDFVRVYLAYTLPAGILSETNPVARYTLPAGLHLTPAQVEAINTHENGYYLSLGDGNAQAGTGAAETEPQDYLGAEAVEGTRTPDQAPSGQEEEYISAVVKVEEIYDEDGNLLSQELVFTFLPYTVEKNGNVYADKDTSADTAVSGSLDDADDAEASDDLTRDLIREGETVSGFLTVDFSTGQIDFADTETDNIKTAEITFARENETEGIGLIRESLTMNTSADFRKARETGTGQEGEENSGSDKKEAETPDDKTAGGKDTTSDEKDADKEKEKKKDLDEDPGEDTDKDAERKKDTDHPADLPADAMPARTFEDSITLETARPASVGESGTVAEAAGALPARSEVKVRVEADEGTFPAGTTMVLSAVDSKDMDAVAEAVENAVANNTDADGKKNSENTKTSKTCGFQAVDISFRDADGNEIEPAKPVRVVMTSSLIKEAAQNNAISAPVVVHVDNEGKGEQIDLIDPEKIETAKGRTEEDLIREAEDKSEAIEEKSEEAEDKSEATQDTSAVTTEEAEIKKNAETDKATSEDSVGYETDCFSVYAIVYTVDFSYLVNGKMYDFSLPGGGFVSFTDLIEVLGIIEGTNSGENDVNSAEVTDEDALTLSDVTVSEETRKFVADVESVEFSNPDLVWVGKVETDSTVGEIKEANGLECEYSAELTEEQIEEINAQTVESGDWALISMLPFESEESLTVTMKTGEVFTIKVTDAQIIKTVIDAKGDTWEITVTYGEDAGIPNDAELKAEEILPEDARYQEYYQKAVEAVSGETAKDNYAHLFDIEIRAGDQKIEPQANVSMSIKLLDAPEDPVSELKVVHFGAEGVEVMETDISGNDETAATAFNSEGTTAELKFMTDEFSVYAVVEPNALETAADVSELDGNMFYVSIDNNNLRYYAKNSLNGNCIAKTNASDISSAALYYFDAVEGTDNQFYIYTIDENGSKKYVRYKSDTSNAFEFSDEATMAFTVEQHTDSGAFYIYYQRSNGNKCAWGYSGNGLIGEVQNARANNKVILTKTLKSDPYGLNGKSYGIIYATTTSGNAMTSTAANSNTRLSGKTMTIKVDPISRTENVYVAKDSNIQMWTFTYISGTEYYITTEVNGALKYLRIASDSISLVEASDTDDNCIITVEEGTGTYSGKYKFSSNGYALKSNGSFQSRADLTTGNDASCWLSFAELSNLNEDDFVTYTATKVSVSGDTDENGNIDYDVKNGDQVIIYTRIWNENTLQYDYYAIDHDGMLVKAYESGDTISWVGTKVNTMLWDFTEYYNDDGTPNYYYELQNAYSGKYIAPQVSGGTFLSDNTIGINMNGRRNGDYYSTIIAWDDPYHDYSALKALNYQLTSAPLSKADTFYFAIMKPDDSEDKLSQVATIDHTSYGITLKMQNYTGTVTGSNCATQTEVLQNTTYNQWNGVKNLLNKYIAEGEEYPTSALTGTSLGQLYGDAMTVNHQFLLSTYQETGYFEFDSTQNFAHLITSESDKWYGVERPDGSGTYEVGDFVVYDQIATTSENNGVTRRHGQFFPYNDLTENSYVNWVNDTDIHGNMLSSLDPRYGEKLYKINFTNKANTDPANAIYFFGMEMDASFMQSESGLDAWGHDLIFEFSGDDDFWLYIDDVLVLDLGGIHSALDGSVNFRTGKVIENGKESTLRERFETAYKAQYPDKTQDEVDAWLDGIFKDGGTVFKDYSGHTMKMYYMERGAGASNIHMRFNLAPYTAGEVLLEKEVSGTETTDSGMLFPFQIFYKDSTTSYVYQPVTGDFSVTDSQDASVPISYAASATVNGMTYEHVFYLKPGQIASIKLPSEETEYYIVECGQDTGTYDKVTINGTENEGTTATKDGYRDYKTAETTVSDQKKVIYDNHVSEDALHSLIVTKKLWREYAKETKITADEDETTFRFRIYIGKDGEDYTVYNTGKYYVKNPAGEYCIYQNGGFVSTGKTVFSELGNTSESVLVKTEQEQATFHTSPGGAADKIPAGYSIEIPGLTDGTAFMVIERSDEIPAGYNLIDYVRSSRETLPEGETANAGVIDRQDETVIVHNQHGYGLTVKKVWSDAAFMDDHDYIYFAVYMKGADDSLTLVDGSVRQLGKTATSLNWFFPELTNGKTLNDYLVYEITLSGDYTVDEAGKVTLGDGCTVTKIEENGTLTVGGTTNEHGYSDKFDYTASYSRQELTEAQLADTSVNSRTDTVTNTRPGIKLVKTDLSGAPLEGAKFTLVKSGNEASKKTFTSDEAGLIAVAYLTSGEEYILTETAAPYKYLSLIDSLTIKVENGTLYVNGETAAAEGACYSIKQVAEPTATDMPTVTISNRAFTLTAVKKDAVNNEAISGVTFALYNETTDYYTGNPMRDYYPKDGFETLVTDENGVIPKIDLDHLAAGTYYLHETGTPTTYQQADYDIRLTISATGQVTIQKAVSTYDSKTKTYSWTFSDIESTEAEVITEADGNVTLVVKNQPAKGVQILKVGDGLKTNPLSGAEFALYKITQISDDQPKDGETPILTGTTDEKGILNLGALDSSTTYYLYETKAPDGYNMLTAPVRIITMSGGKISAYLTGPLDVTTIEEEDRTEVVRIQVSNSSGYELPSTGGPGTWLYTILGSILILGAGVLLWRRRRLI